MYVIEYKYHNCDIYPFVGYQCYCLIDFHQYCSLLSQSDGFDRVVYDDTSYYLPIYFDYVVDNVAICDDPTMNIMEMFP